MAGGSRGNQRFEEELRLLVQEFISRVTVLAGTAALDATRAQLATGAGVPPRRHGPARARAPAPKTAAAPDIAPRAPLAPPRRPAQGRGDRAQQRTIQRASLGASVVSYLLARPGQPIAAIRGALGAPPAVLTLVLKYLTAEGLIRAEGTARNRLYFPDQAAVPAPEQAPQPQSPEP